MNERCNKALMPDFIDAFIATYKPMPLNQPYDGKAYGSSYRLTETRACYKVTIKGITKRFSTLYSAASYIYEHTYNPKKIYNKPLSAFQARRRQTSMTISSIRAYAMAM